MCIPSKANPQGLVFKGIDTTFARNQDTLMSSSSLFNDNQSARDEAFQSLQTQQAMKHCVQHNYHDHANDDDAIYLEAPIVTKGGVSVPFPMKLHNMLDHIELFEPELSSIIRWQPHGRCFLVKNSKTFAADVLPRFFDQRKYASFQRQLNLYGFNRITAGPDKGSYYHELFLRSKKILCRGIQRMKIKGTGTRMASNPDQEPNFYVMETMPPASTSAPRKKIQQDSTMNCNNKDNDSNNPTLIKKEGDLSNGEEDMPSLQLPMTVHSIDEQIHSQQQQGNKEISLGAGYISSQVDDTPINATSQNNMISTTVNNFVVEREDPRQPYDSTSDLKFVFGNMQFHSIDTSIPYNERRHSFMVPISSDESSSTPPLDDAEEFDKDFDNILDANMISDFSDEDMSNVLEKIVNQEV